MDQVGEPETVGPGAASAGAMLAAARADAGLDLAAVAAQTRIPLRHLQAIEAGDYASLPSRTYAIGFSRTYARLLGLDERVVIDQVRRDLGDEMGGGPARHDRFEPGDPARVPSSRLAWLSLLAVVLLVIGGFSFYRTYFSPGLGPAPLTEPTRKPVPSAAPQKPSAAPALPTGPVVITSLADGTWLQVKDSAGKRLFEGLLAKGEGYTVPADAVGPRARTGRPDLFAVTIGGTSVAPLGTEPKLVKDVAVDAASLNARVLAAAASPTATATPATPPPPPVATAT